MRSKPGLPRRRALALLWHWKRFQPTSEGWRCCSNGGPKDSQVHHGRSGPSLSWPSAESDTLLRRKSLRVWTLTYRRVRSTHTADNENHIDKHEFKVPFVCGARNLGEALRRIAEGAAMIRTKGEAGTGNVVEGS
eukprot:Em0016g73a